MSASCFLRCRDTRTHTLASVIVDRREKKGFTSKHCGNSSYVGALYFGVRINKSKLKKKLFEAHYQTPTSRCRFTVSSVVENINPYTSKYSLRLLGGLNQSKTLRDPAMTVCRASTVHINQLLSKHSMRYITPTSRCHKVVASVVEK